MRIELLLKNKVYELKEPTDFNKTLLSDLELTYIGRIAAGSDQYLNDVYIKVLLDMLTNEEDIVYRQEVLKDVLANQGAVRNMYNFVTNVVMMTKQNYRFGVVTKSALATVSSCQSLLEHLIRCAGMMNNYIAPFENVKSEGLNTMLTSAKETFSKENIEKAFFLVKQIDVENGFMGSTTLNQNMEDANYDVNRSTYNDKDSKKRWKKAEKITFPYLSESLVNEINRKLDSYVLEIAYPMKKATVSLIEYFEHLRMELGFYLCEANVINYLNSKGYPYCFPNVGKNYQYEGLYDMALSIKKETLAIPNSHNIIDKKIVIITGANQGGKTSFLRSFGQAKLFFQAGLVIPATKATLAVSNGLFTHFDKEEDSKMDSGKFDEELKRISYFVDNVKPGAMIFLNESFQSTNEHEGSLIGKEIIKALVDSGIYVVLVTHMYELAMSIKDIYKEDIHFLRASRDENGKRSFILEEAEPLKTSFAMDLYNNLFNEK